MKRQGSYRWRWALVSVGVALALGGENARADFTFGEPTKLGSTVNTRYVDMIGCMSADGLECYISSNRPGGLGDMDLWAMKRATREDDWEPAVNLGPGVNSSQLDVVGGLSPDGRELFFTTCDRPGGCGGFVVWVSSRQT